MTDVTAGCWGATSFDGGFGLRRDRLRFVRLLGSAFVGLGTVAGACLPFVAVGAAAWIMIAPHGAIPRPDLRVPPAPLLIAATEPQPSVAAHVPTSGVTSIAKSTPAKTVAPAAPHSAQRSFESRWADAFGPVAVRHTVASVGYDTPVEQPAPVQQTAAVEPSDVPLPLPRPRPEIASQQSAKPEIARGAAPVANTQVASAVAPLPAARAGAPAPMQLASLPQAGEKPAPRTTTAAKSVPENKAAEKTAPIKEAHNRGMALPARDSRTAIYDISARTVYMPNGEKLEAHSGLGEKMDNPRYVHVKMRGPTPPNVYELTLREQLFHGVRAIRLNPVDEKKMFGRDGMLAHTYMLGPKGASNGCVSFKDYSKFLRAYLNGEVNRLVVVPHLGDTPLSVARDASDDDDRYAAASPSARSSSLTW
ncbi:MAG TPA: tlde1 domain-containing protein [Pseudolabrys sp.]|nr:tlde1 domain-containing protein [Pseudolabrys sp.]